MIEKENLIRVDGGRFVFEEALQLVKMLNSRNPFTQISANFMIWERNGFLRTFVLVLIVIIIAIVIILVRR